MAKEKINHTAKRPWRLLSRLSKMESASGKPAGCMYCVPRTALGDRIADRHSTGHGRQPELTADEQNISAMVQLLSIWGFPFISADLRYFVKNHINRRGAVTRFKDNLLTHRSNSLYWSENQCCRTRTISF